jgi:hypothetical protein
MSKREVPAKERLLENDELGEYLDDKLSKFDTENSRLELIK